MRLALSINKSQPAVSFFAIAEQLMNGYLLQVRNKYYRIIDCEFYYHHIGHQDGYVHRHKLQIESSGEWYFHGSGLDITLGDGESYGGVLLRGIAEIDGALPQPHLAAAVHGPINVLTEVFKSFGSAFSTQPLEFGLVDITKDMMGAGMVRSRVFSVPRVGLNSSIDNGSFFEKAYRYLAFLHMKHGNGDQIKKYLLESRQVTDVQYKQFESGKQWL